jgi:hypothetical protein
MVLIDINTVTSTKYVPKERDTSRSAEKQEYFKTMSEKYGSTDWGEIKQRQQAERDKSKREYEERKAKREQNQKEYEERQKKRDERQKEKDTWYEKNKDRLHAEWQERQSERNRREGQRMSRSTGVIPGAWRTACREEGW